MGKFRISEKQERTINEFKKTLAGFSEEALSEVIKGNYEVEPEYNAGDWVVWHGDVVKIKYPQTTERKDDGRCYFTIIRSDDSTYTNILRSNIRHATPEEIKAEQERRQWAEIGREPGEFRDGDVVLTAFDSISDQVNLIKKCTNLLIAKQEYKSKIIKGFYPAESFIEFGGADE
ncbi:hypothetical protein SporoP37_02045 [Sporosarcina sp. P37]|uniref:hypothetical protein n=1 Tax=unclassified Sporosarcina TaxID=2647733 RepID=UPI000A17E9D5|nr:MULTISPECIES: hypothetical protein [unclassified Sporosarcina]ARK23591.1 hypothetical protein SporoP37_02045 [Sporosarcina sp. P37]PID18785.1 hypothetical protein CSV62_06705 [Sporosarcina sp. P35]